ncbi:MAG TPA: GNAT family N-acetyltransferase [Anaerolineales bacterium]|nr:GNAT family N-acetyltransferase [Anaerolineales bacterium]
MDIPITILETNRLSLRRFTKNDLKALVAFFSDPDLVKHIPDAPKPLEETKEELEWHMNGHPKNSSLGLWATIYKETDDFIGRCGLLHGRLIVKSKWRWRLHCPRNIGGWDWQLKQHRESSVMRSMS